MSTKFDVKQLPEFLDFNYEHIQKSRERQCRAWRGEKLDVPLLFIGGELSEKQKVIPEYNYKEIFTDKEKMLCCEVRAACAVGNGVAIVFHQFARTWELLLSWRVLVLNKSLSPTKCPGWLST